MALYKAVVQEDGIITNYHRILYTMSHINSHVSIAVVSYVDQNARSMEVENAQPYRRYITFETDYKENMTIEDAYRYLKTLKIFNEASDV